MVDAFGAVSFLTRSSNRVEVLGALATGPSTKRELVAETGVSDVTLRRILDDFVERGWVTERAAGDGDPVYETTPLGNLLAEDYGRLVDSADLAERLGPVYDLLPVASMTEAFDLRRLDDARITDPETYDSLRTVDRWLALVRRADHIRVVGPPGSTMGAVVQTVRDEVVDGGMTFEAVVGPGFFEPPEGRPELGPPHAEMVEAGAEVYQLPEGHPAPPCVATYDDLAAVAGFDDSSSMRVGIESTDEVVYDWVVSTFERHREAATQLDAAAFRS